MTSTISDDPKYRSIHRIKNSSQSHRNLPPIIGFEREPLVSLEKAVEPLMDIVPQVKHMVSIVKHSRSSAKNVGTLTNDESAAICLYTLGWKTLQTSFHHIFNRTLRSEHRQNLVPWFLYLRLFLHALSKLPTCSINLFFFGIQADIGHDYVENEIFVWWDTLSCTSSMKTLETTLNVDETRTVFLIESNSAKDISHYSFYQTGDEYVLYPARQFRVMSSYQSSDLLKIVHLKEIQPLSPLISLPGSEVFSTYSNQQIESIIGQCPDHSIIDLRNLKLTDADVPIIIEQAIVRKKCRELWLQSNKISSNGALILARALQHRTSMEVLILHDNQIEDIGVRALAAAFSLSLSSLQVLGLEATGMTDEGVSHLSKMLKKNRSLKSIGLGENQITNRGVQSLSSVLIHNNNTLRELYLVRNKRIDDQCIDFLIRMLRINRTLNRLWMDDCNLTNKGKEKLRSSILIRNRFSLSL